MEDEKALPGISFMTPEAIRSNDEWSRRQNAKAQQMIQDEGFMTIDQMLEAAEENCQRSLRCKKCELQCSTYCNLDRHRGSENCKKRQAAQKGEDYVPKCQTTRRCEVCDLTIKFYNWTRHLTRRLTKKCFGSFTNRRSTARSVIRSLAGSDPSHAQKSTSRRRSI